MRAEATDFHGLLVHPEPGGLCVFPEGMGDAGAVQLRDGVALAADEELGGVVYRFVKAGNEGVEAGEAMHQPLLHEEVQRPVDGDGGLALLRPIQAFQNFVGSEGDVTGSHDFQHLSPLLSQANLPALTNRLGVLQKAGQADPVVMGRFRKRSGVRGHQGSRQGADSNQVLIFL